MFFSLIKKILVFHFVFVLFMLSLSASDNMIVEDLVNVGKSTGMSGSPEVLLNSIQRDPFYRILDQAGSDASAIIDYDLSDLVLLAVVWDIAKPIAMFKAPKDKKFIVSLGDRIGRNEGRIVGISDGKVYITENHLGLDGNRIEKSIIKGVGK
jgi:hypothetical protein